MNKNMCICKSSKKQKNPDGKVGIIKNRHDYFLSFRSMGMYQDNTIIPIIYCPYCGRKLKKSTDNEFRKINKFTCIQRTEYI